MPCEWHPVQTVILMKEVWDHNRVHWEGSWKDLDHRYLAFELYIKGKAHLGWVELKADIYAKRVILYRAAYSKEPQSIIRVGY